VGGAAELGDVGEPMIGKLLVAALVAWVARWLALEAAGYLGRKLPPRVSPLESPRPPGWMPRRLDSLTG
jgi:hypothetical protein